MNFAAQVMREESMNLDATLTKTEKGLEELSTRKYKLDSRLRTILIVVNGRSTAGDLLSRFDQIDDVEVAVGRLLSEGFIKELTSGASFKTLRGELAHAITNALGPDGDSVAMMLEKCNSIDELRTVLVEKRQMLENILGTRGTAFWAKARDVFV